MNFGLLVVCCLSFGLFGWCEFSFGGCIVLFIFTLVLVLMDAWFALFVCVLVLLLFVHLFCFAFIC